MSGTQVTMDDSTDFERRFGGLRRLYGVAGAQRVFDAHVVVVGIGGVGSWSAEALARSGVGRITLVDMDHIAESNVNRQVHALQDTFGQAKVLAMQARMAQIHPAVRVCCIDDFVQPDNWPRLLDMAVAAQGPVDAVIDACDQVSAKVAMASAALLADWHFVAVGAAGGKRLAHKVDVDDLHATTHDPLLAQLRYRLRRQFGAAREGHIGVDCVFSREAVAPPDPSCAIDGDGSLNCHGYGSAVAVTATFGLCAAGWAIERLAQGRKKRATHRSRTKTSGHSKSAGNDAII